MKRNHLVFLLSILSLNLFCQTHWTKHPDNPVMLAGTSGDWDKNQVMPRTVIYQDSMYQMWYWGGDFNVHKFQIGYATSPDGINWTKDTLHNPVLKQGPVGAWDDKVVSQPSVLFRDSSYHMWYTGNHKTASGTIYKNGHATSTDGSNWTKDSLNPVLVPGPAGSWDDEIVADHTVIHDGNKYHMWYLGGSGNGLFHLGHATSTDGSNWTKDSLNPVLMKDESWEGRGIEWNMVVYDDTVFHLWYCGGGLGTWVVGYATSLDGINWTKDTRNPIFKGTPGTWNEKYISGTAILDSAHIKYKMWYTGITKGLGYADIGYAETYDPAWKQMESMELARGGLGSCVIDSMIYVFGGADASVDNSIDSADVFNTKTNQWSDLAAMPYDAMSPIAESTNGKIYLAGGWRCTGVNSWITTNSTVEYDPEGDTWQAKTACPGQTGSSASGVMKDTIYLLGGATEFEPRDAQKAWYYMPGTDSWGSLPDMIYKRPMGLSADILDNKIYVFGGTYKSELNHPSGKGEMYDPQLGIWAELADMPVHVINHFSIVHDDKILLFGGDSSQNSIGQWGTSIGTNFIQEYDPVADSWQLMEPMPFKRASMAGEKVDNFVYLIGGYLNSRDLDEPLSEVWRFDLDSLKEWVVPCNEVMISESSLTLAVNDKDTLSASVLPTYAADRTVSWSSSDEGVATVSAEGMVTAVSDGDATFTATANGGGCTATCELTVISGVGIEKDKAGHFALFPNPVNDLLTVHTGITESHLVEITSLNGQVVYSKTMDRSTYQIDLSLFEKGVYFFTIGSKDFVITRKVIKL
jgi:N-acetylneuraminic acid mutarotase/predicted GH43/DUF377 family glycosyl hydrolase